MRALRLQGILMSNRTPEQDLIDQFMAYLQSHEDDDLRISEVIKSEL